MDIYDTMATISGNDVIMAYGGSTKCLVRHRGDTGCTGLFWSRYALFVTHLLIMASGATLIGLGAWVQVYDTGLELFESHLHAPSWMLISTGVFMAVLGVCGCAGAVRPKVNFLGLLRLFVMFMIVVQIMMGGFMGLELYDIESKMLNTIHSTVATYVQGSGQADHLALDHLQRKYQCCGGSDFTDWDSNVHFNCSPLTVSTCGVPTSCCRGSRDDNCGYGIREGTVDYTAMFAYTEGCIETVIDIFKEHVIVISSVAVFVSLLEVCSVVLASVIVRKIVQQRQLDPWELPPLSLVGEVELLK